MIRKIAGVGVAVLFGLGLAPLTAMATTFHAGTYVYDSVGALSTTATQALESTARSLATQYRTPVVMVISTGSDPGSVVRQKAANDLSTGNVQTSGGAKDGVVVEVELRPSDQTHGAAGIAVGASQLRNALPQAEVDRIYNSVLVGGLKGGDLNGALTQTLAAIQQDESNYAAAHNGSTTATTNGGGSSASGGGFIWFLLAILIVVAIVVLIVVRAARRRAQYGSGGAPGMGTGGGYGGGNYNQGYGPGYGGPGYGGGGIGPLGAGLGGAALGGVVGYELGRESAEDDRGRGYGGNSGDGGNGGDTGWGGGGNDASSGGYSTGGDFGGGGGGDSGGGGGGDF